MISLLPNIIDAHGFGYDGGLCDKDMARKGWQVPVAASPVDTNVFAHDVVAS
jgi:hypothetical protein